METQERLIDCKGLRCPMPIVRVGVVMRSLTAGQRVVVEATDPAFETDLSAWARQTGHRVVSFQRGDIQIAQIEKV